nr:transcription factor bHLH68-like isoform X2 [Tanacetum cinerariifolium]
TGLANDQEQHNLVARHVGEAKLGYLDNQQSRQPFYSHKNDHHDQNNSIEDDQQVCSSTWSSQLNPVPSVGSSSTMSLSTTTMFDFSSKMDSRNQHTTQYSSQYDDTSTSSGASKKGRFQSSSTQASPMCNDTFTSGTSKRARAQQSSTQTPLKYDDTSTSSGASKKGRFQSSSTQASPMCNDTFTSGTSKRARAQQSSTQTPLKVTAFFLISKNGYLSFLVKNNHNFGTEIQYVYLREWERERCKGEDLNRNKKNTSSGIGVSNDSKDSMNDDSPIGVAPAVREGVTPSVVDMTVEMGKQTSNAPSKCSYAHITSKPSGKKVNVRTLFTPEGNRIDVVVLVDSIWAISKRFANTAYGFFFGKKVAHPVVANYVRNTWGKYDLVRLMFSSSTSKDGVSAISTKLGTPICACNLGKPPRCSSCKVFGHVHEECTKNTGAGEKKTEYRPVTKKPNTSSSGNKKKGMEPTIKVSNSNPFDILNLVDNDGEFGTNWGTNNLVNNEATSIGSSFMNIDNDGDSTGIMESDSEVELVFDETANLRIPTSGKNESDKGYGTSSFLEQWKDSYPNNVDYDSYDDYMYKNHDLSEHPWQEEEIAG